MERNLIGEGSQHQVFKSRNPEYVLKKPKFWYTFRFYVLGFKASSIVDDIEEVSSSMDSSIVRIPKTRVFPFKRGYIMTQKFVAEDNSVTDIKDKLANNKYLLSRYISNPSNFISNEGVIYLVDPAIANIIRKLTQLGIDKTRLYDCVIVRTKLILRRAGLMRDPFKN